MIKDNIVSLALAYANANITEIQVNRGWTDKAYERDMIQLTNWYPGAEWCAAAAILTWKKGYSTQPAMLPVIERLVSLNSLQMIHNFHNDPIWHTSYNVPQVGAMAVWGLGDSHVMGHVGIVTAVNAGQFDSVEGNTNGPGRADTRTGWTVAKHCHMVGLPHSLYDLNLIGFIYAIETYTKWI